MTPHPREDWVSRFSEPDTGIVCSCQQHLPVRPRKCHLSILALLLTQWRPRLGRGREEINCLVSLGGEIPSGAELGSRCVLCEQEDDFIHRLNNWRTQQRWGWSWYQTFIWGPTGCLGLKLGSGGETRAGGCEGCYVGSGCESPRPPGALPHSVKFRYHLTESCVLYFLTLTLTRTTLAGHTPILPLLPPPSLPGPPACLTLHFYLEGVL